METIIAACGLDCKACPAYIAWKTDDQELRIKTAAAWSKEFGFDAKPEMINCVGCLTDTEGPRVGHCAECEFRSCALERHVSTCAGCGEFPCKPIAGFHAQVPAAKANLEAIRG